MEPQYNWAALALPVFMTATVAEVVLGQRRGKPVYAFGTAIADLACGSVFQACELLINLATFGAYIWLYQNYRLIEFDAHSVVPWLVGIVGVDLLFYWWHRTSHVVNVLWAVHGVHHQSEDYNLAVALRQPVFEPLTWFLFYGVLALVGVSPMIYLAAYGLNRFYQFWIHTELVQRGPAPIEWLFNTPSHHRVHHGIETQYLDRNYGAILIVWDRLFGTFTPEQQRPCYGTTIPLRSYSPLWANMEHFSRIRLLMGGANNWRERLWAPFAHPAWLPRGFVDTTRKPDRTNYEKYRPAVPRALRAYVLLHFSLIGSALGVVVFYEHWLTTLQLGACAAPLVASYVALTGLLEQARWAIWLDRARMVALLVLLPWVLGAATSLTTTTLASCSAGLLLLFLGSQPLLRRP